MYCFFRLYPVIGVRLSPLSQQSLSLSAFLFFPKGQADDNAFVMSEQTPFPELIEEELEEEIETIVQLAPDPIIVDVKGAVRHPGVYSMSRRRPSD